VRALPEGHTEKTMSQERPSTAENTTVIRVFRGDAQRLEEIRRALVVQAGGAHQTAADALHEVMKTGPYANRPAAKATP
jgi:hypothetical protein